MHRGFHSISYNLKTRSHLMRKSLILLLAGMAVLLLAPLTASAQSSPVNVRFDGLEPLGASAVYEGWLIIDGAPQSTGTFNLDSNGNLIEVRNQPVANAASATAYVLTIEPAVDPDPAPASTHVLAGDFVDGVAQLSISHPAALGTDFATATGQYIIKTPTTETNDDDRSGVWFLDPTGADGPVAALDLPTLPAGWEYEGWVVIDGNPLSTGRFTDASGADDFSGFSGPLGGPPYPGEDFIVNAPAGLSFPTDLSGRTVVISVEPAPDDSPAPFALKPLVGTVAADVTPGSLHTLGDGPVGISGTAILSNATAAPGASDEAPATDAPAATAGTTEAELAFTGAESWYLAAGGMLVIAIGAVFVAGSRKFAHA